MASYCDNMSDRSFMSAIENDYRFGLMNFNRLMELMAERQTYKLSSLSLANEVCSFDGDLASNCVKRDKCYAKSYVIRLTNT